MEHLTLAERRERLARLLLRGVFLYAQKQGWVNENNERISNDLNLKEEAIKEVKKRRQEPLKDV